MELQRRLLAAGDSLSLFIVSFLFHLDYHRTAENFSAEEQPKHGLVFFRSPLIGN